MNEYTEWAKKILKGRIRGSISDINISLLTGMVGGSRDRIRELVRLRDDHTCQICGHVWIKGERRLDVHHKDCDKNKTRGVDNYERDQHNMITICHKCHLNIDLHRESIKIGWNKKKEFDAHKSHKNPNKRVKGLEGFLDTK